MVVVLCINFLVVTIALAQTKILTWTGCGITNKAFMAEIATAYEEKTGIKITLSGGGATKGIRAASAGTSDMGGTCRHWLGGINNKHPQEKDAVLIQVAWDALVVITNPDNPVSNISLDNLKKVYEGKITSWKDLGGPDKKIFLVTREGKYSGVGHMFRGLVFEDPEYTFEARSLKVKSSGPLEKKIEKTMTAMGITGISSAKRRNVKVLDLDGISPTKENIASGKYFLFRPLYIAINKDAPIETRKVIDFMLSFEGQAIVSQVGTVNLEEGKALEQIWEQKKGKLGL